LFLEACQKIEGVEFNTYAEAVKKIITENEKEYLTIK
jgi:hypothetical protein